MTPNDYCEGCDKGDYRLVVEDFLPDVTPQLVWKVEEAAWLRLSVCWSLPSSRHILPWSLAQA